MGMDLYLDAQIDATSHIGKHRIRATFGLHQTPTKITEMILSSSNIKQAYIDWVMEDNFIEKIEIYAPEDVFCELEPIGYEERRYDEDHVQDLENWFKQHEGWEIEWYSL